MITGETILWRRLDIPGHEFAAIVRQADEWILTGVALFVETGSPCRVDYEIRCDAEWITRRCSLRGLVGSQQVRHDIEHRVTGEWSVDGIDMPALRDCDDVDLGFSPITNLLPIRRLALPSGTRADVRAAWVRFPEFTVEVLAQSYTRVDSDRYVYESAGGEFRRELGVDAFGCVISYPGLWRAEATVLHETPAPNADEDMPPARGVAPQ